MKLMIKNRVPKAKVKQEYSDMVLMRKVEQLEDKVKQLEARVDEVNNKVNKALSVP